MAYDFADTPNQFAVMPNDLTIMPDDLAVMKNDFVCGLIGRDRLFQHCYARRGAAEEVGRLAAQRGDVSDAGSALDVDWAVDAVQCQLRRKQRRRDHNVGD